MNENKVKLLFAVFSTGNVLALKPKVSMVDKPNSAPLKTIIQSYAYVQSFVLL